MAAARHFIFDLPLCVLLSISGAACATSGGAKPQIPSGAQLIGSTLDRKVIPYVALEPGTLYVVDQETGKLVFTAAMSLRDQVVFHAARDMVFFNGQLVREGGFDPKRTYVVYFVKS